MPPRFTGPAYPCPRCGSFAKMLCLSPADLRHNGYELFMPGAYVNWCGHAQEFLSPLNADGWCTWSRSSARRRDAEWILYFALTGAIEAGLIRTMEDVLTVLRQASQRLGPMGAEWLTWRGAGHCEVRDDGS